MANYRKCTCYSCGKIDIQPNMNRRTIEVDSGSSQAGLSNRALATSMLFGSKKGANQVNNWFTGNTKRKYKRNKEVWLCDTCAGVVKVPSKGFIGKTAKLLDWIFTLGIILTIIYFVMKMSGG